MSEIKIRKLLGKDVRFVKIENDYWVVAGDVAEAMGLYRGNNITRTMDKDNYKLKDIETPGGPQRKAVISMDGLKTYLVNSRKKRAKDLLIDLGEDINIYKYKNQPKQIEFEKLLIEQIQRFYNTGDCSYTNWNYYVGYGILLPDALNFKTEYRIPGTNYRVDFYMDGLDIIIEYDEKHHISNLEKDSKREAEIIDAMIDIDRCPTFIRVTEGEEYQGIIDLFALMFKQRG